MKIINNPAMPKPAGHYSLCIEHNGLLYLSGQLPKDPKTGEIPEGIRAQTRRALENVKLIVEGAGSSLNWIIQVRIYLSDVAYWEEVNEEYSQFFGDHRPVRTVVPSRDLHYGALVEIEALAAAPE